MASELYSTSARNRSSLSRSAASAGGAGGAGGARGAARCFVGRLGRLERGLIERQVGDSGGIGKTTPACRGQLRVGRSSTSRTLRARLSAVNGFWRYEIPASSTPCRTTASSVYPDA